MSKYYGIVACILLLISPGCKKREQNVPAQEVYPVKLFNITDSCKYSYRIFPARVRASRRVKLAFQVSGPLVEFPVRQGEEVKEGQLLAQIDPRDYQHSLELVEAQFNQESAEFKRYTQLINENAVSMAAYEERKRNYRIAEVNLKIARKALEDTTLHAPFAGIVAEKYVFNYHNVSAKQPILSLQDVDMLEIVVDVPEADMLTPAGQRTLLFENVEKQLQPTVNFPTISNRHFPLKIKEFEAEADPVTQTFKFILQLKTPDDLRVMPGMTAVVRVREDFFISMIPHNHKCFRIPCDAIFQGNDQKSYVWLLNPQSMIVRKHEITLRQGLPEKDTVMVNSGLKEGDEIVMAGVHSLRDGVKVRRLTRIGNKEIQ